MARFGSWRPLAGPPLPPLTADIICLHTMVASLAQTDRNFRAQGTAGTFSHFGVGEVGEIVQWQDTALRAAANLDGNHRVISIETADRGGLFLAWDTSRDDVPEWTPAQVDSLGMLVAAMCHAHAIPCELIPDTRPGRRGVAYHRQGCDGNYADGRKPGGELWSSARGKVCPGDRRIAQIPTVLARARAILGTVVSSSPNGPAAPPTTSTPGGDVELTDRLPDAFTATPGDTLSVADTLAFACAHAAFARRDAAAALATAQRIEEKVNAILASVKVLRGAGPVA